MTNETSRTTEEMARFRALFGAMPQKGQEANYYEWKLRTGTPTEGHLAMVKMQERIAGTASVTAKRIAVHGKLHLGFEIGDTYTHPDFRRMGVFLSAVQECCRYVVERNGEFIYGTPNDASLPGYEKKANFVRVPDLRIAVMTKHISPRSASAAIARRTGTTTGAGMLGLAVSWFNQVKGSRGADSSISVSESHFGEFPDVDGLWGDRAGFSFWTVRDREYINWRYEKNPDDYTLFLAHRGSTAVGYVVTKRFVRGDNVVGAICDFATIGDCKIALGALVAAAEKTLASEGVDYCEVWCATRSRQTPVLRAAGYREITSFPVIVFSESALFSSVVGSGNWHFTLSDSDNI